jgi:hypothetical protein
MRALAFWLSLLAIDQLIFIVPASRCVDSFAYWISSYVPGSGFNLSLAGDYIDEEAEYFQRHFAIAVGIPAISAIALGQDNPAVLNITQYKWQCVEDKAFGGDPLLKCEGRGEYHSYLNKDGPAFDWYRVRCDKTTGKITHFGTYTEALDLWGYELLGVDSQSASFFNGLLQGTCVVKVVYCDGIPLTSPGFFPAFGACFTSYALSGIATGNLTTSDRNTHICRSFWSNIVPSDPVTYCPYLGLSPTEGCDDANAARDYGFDAQSATLGAIGGIILMGGGS